MAELPDVQVGDVWKDNDERGGPTVRVLGVCATTRACAHSYKGPHAHVVTVPGDKRPRAILLRRFRPGRRGYQMVSRVDPEDLCPMGCGRTTDDVAGGPCSTCWDEAPRD